MERIDVVCQRPVEMSIAQASGLTLEREGHVFYFCSKQCMDQFVHEPQQYMGRLDVEYGRANLSEGIGPGAGT